MQNQQVKILAGLLFWANSIFCQFFGLLQTSPARYYYNILPSTSDSLVRVAAFEQHSLTVNNQVIIFTFSSTQVVDSNYLPRSLYPGAATPLYSEGKYFWPSIFSDTVSNTGSIFAISQFDTLFHYTSIHPITIFDQSSKIPLDIVKIGNNYYTGVYSPSLSQSTLYKLNTQFLIVDSVMINKQVEQLSSNGENLTMSGRWFNTPCTATGKTQWIKMDSSFQIIDCKSYDSVGVLQWGSINNLLFVEGQRYSKVIQLTKQKTLTLSNLPYFDSPFDPASDGVLYTIYDHSTNTLTTIPVYEKNVSHSFNDWTKYYDYENGNLVTVACIGYDWSQQPYLQSQETKMLVTMMDTTGKILWTKYHGGQSYYFPRCIKFVKNGIIIAGLRSDTENPPITMESFLLRLTVQGEVSTVGMPDLRKTADLAIFPNPSNDFIRIRTSSTKLFEIYVTDIQGRQLINTLLTNDAYLSVKELQVGCYILVVKGDWGTTATKLIRY